MKRLKIKNRVAFNRLISDTESNYRDLQSFNWNKTEQPRKYWYDKYVLAIHKQSRLAFIMGTILYDRRDSNLWEGILTKEDISYLKCAARLKKDFPVDKFLTSKKNKDYVI